MSGLLRVDSSPATIIHIPSYPGLEEEYSQKSITDEKIEKMCNKCLISKNSLELQKISHKKVKENNDDVPLECPAHEQALYCRSCVIQLDPKICPICRDELSISQENSIQAEESEVENPHLPHAVNININVQNQDRSDFPYGVVATIAAIITVCVGGYIFLWQMDV